MASGEFVKVVAKDAEFDGEVLTGTDLVLVDLGATWCGPCKALAPIVNKIAEDFQGKVKVVTASGS